MRSIDRSNDRSIGVSQALFALFSHEKTGNRVETKTCRGVFFANFELTAGISLRTNSRVSNAHKLFIL